MSAVKFNSFEFTQTNGKKLMTSRLHSNLTRHSMKHWIICIYWHICWKTLAVRNRSNLARCTMGKCHCINLFDSNKADTVKSWLQESIWILQGLGWKTRTGRTYSNVMRWKTIGARIHSNLTKHLIQNYDWENSYEFQKSFTEKLTAKMHSQLTKHTIKKKKKKNVTTKYYSKSNKIYDENPWLQELIPNSTR